MLWILVIYVYADQRSCSFRTLSTKRKYIFFLSKDWHCHFSMNIYIFPYCLMCILFIRSLRVWELLPEANYDKRYHSRSILLFLFFMYVHARTRLGCKIKLSSWQLNHLTSCLIGLHHIVICLMQSFQFPN